MLLTYLFIEFGFALGQYLVLAKFFRRYYQRLIDKYITSYEGQEMNIHEQDLRISLNSLNIFGQLPGNNSGPGKAQTAIARIIIGAVMIGNHITVIKTMETAYKGDLTMLFLVKSAAATVMSIFYIMYLVSNNRNKYSPKVPTRLLIITGLTLLWAFTLADQVSPAIIFIKSLHP